MSYEVPCALCGEPVNVQDSRMYRRCQGWERIAGRRTSGKHGGSDITLREPLDEWAHPHCVDRAKSGVSVGQGALL